MFSVHILKEQQYVVEFLQGHVGCVGTSWCELSVFMTHTKFRVIFTVLLKWLVGGAAASWCEFSVFIA